MHLGTVGIVGVGLIGGSIALALKERKLADEVVGIGYRKSTLDRARRMGAIDRSTTDVARGVRAADLVVVATPVGLIPGLVRKVVAAAPSNCVVTDVGSTKQWIARELRDLPSFVPSHPIAGSEARGNDSARSDLFREALCIVTPPKSASAQAVSRVAALWRSIGMRVVRMTPARHDEVLGAVSHLPHVVACLLAETVRPSQLPFVGKGFLDTTRIAAGDPGLWADVLLTNRRAIVSRLKELADACVRVEKMLRTGDERALLAFLTRAKKRRDSLKRKSQDE